MFRNDLKNRKVPVVTVPKKKHMMCLNESHVDLWNLLKPEFIKNLDKIQLNRYRSSVTDELLTKLADYAKVNKNQLIFGQGADDMLYTIFTAVRQNENSFALSLGPSYFDYSTYCQAVGMHTKTINLDENFEFDADKYIELTKNPNCKLAILCNPNNPTANLYSPKKLLKIIKNVKVPVLLDETYFEFSKTTLLPYLDENPNLIIVRSFSKAFSAAGLRFGYAISSIDNINQLKKCRMLFHNSLAIQAFALTILENKEKVLSFTEKVIEMRQELFEKLSKLDKIKVYPSNTNFLLFTNGEKYKDLYNYILSQDIAIRNVSGSVKNHLRVSVSSKADNEVFYNAVVRYLNNHA